MSLTIQIPGYYSALGQKIFNFFYSMKILWIFKIYRPNLSYLLISGKIIIKKNTINRHSTPHDINLWNEYI